MDVGRVEKAINVPTKEMFSMAFTANGKRQAEIFITTTKKKAFFLSK